MKLLAIASDLNIDDFGGAEYNFVEITKRISTNFEEVCIILGSNDSVKKLLHKNKNIRCKAVWYPRITNFMGLFYILFATIPAIFEYLKLKPDIIWAKQEFPQGVIGVILKVAFRKTLFVTTQSARLHKDELVITGNVPLVIKNLFTRIAGFAINIVFKQADIVLAVSKFSAKEAKSRGAKSIVIVPNGVDSNLFLLKRKPPKIFTIVSTSSLIYRNGLDTLIKAVSVLPKKVDWKLVIAGIGPLEQDLKKLARELGIQNRVRFAGYVPNKRIPDLLGRASVFVRVSRAEGFGSSFLESMAIGLPTIGTPVGGITDFLRDGQNGFLVPPDDEIALKRLLEKVSRGGEKIEKIAKKGKETVLKHFNWDQIAAIVAKEMLKLR